MNSMTQLPRRSFMGGVSATIAGVAAGGFTNAEGATAQQNTGNAVTDVTSFHVIGDAQADDTNALQQAIDEGTHTLFLPRGDYRLTRPLRVDLAKRHYFTMQGAAGARLLMEGPGPAIEITGTLHGTSGNPEPEVFDLQRRPMIADIEIVGGHAESDGITLERTWQAVISRCSIRNCRHGIHVTGHNRNPIIADTHIYGCTETGIFYDHVNLHQSIVTGCHISFNKRAGILVRNGAVFNVQIVGNDIEYNYDTSLPDCADICFDMSDGSGIHEVEIAGNTIQAQQSPGGACIRMIGEEPEKLKQRNYFRSQVGLVAISGNHIGHQETNIHLQYCQGVTITGNAIDSGMANNLKLEDCANIVVTGNVFERIKPLTRHPAGPAVNRLLVQRCRACLISNCTLEEFHADDAALVVRDSREISLSNLTITNPKVCGIAMDNVRNCRVSDCTIMDTREPKIMQESLRIVRGSGSIIHHNRLTPGLNGQLMIEDPTGLIEGNVIAAD